MNPELNVKNLFILVGILFIIFYLFKSQTEGFSDYTKIQSEYTKEMKNDSAKACSQRAIVDAVNHYVFGGVKSTR